jgi:hypothetical protein
MVLGGNVIERHSILPFGNKFPILKSVALSWTICFGDIMPLKDCHLILGRAWQYDSSTIYDCRENTYIQSTRMERRWCCFH